MLARASRGLGRARWRRGRAVVAVRRAVHCAGRLCARPPAPAAERARVLPLAAALRLLSGAPVARPAASSLSAGSQSSEKEPRCTCAPALRVSIPDQATLQSAPHALPRHALTRAGGIDVGLHPSASGGPRLTSCAARTCSAGRPAPVLLKNAFFTDARAFSSRPRRVGQCSTLRSAPEGRVSDAGHRAGAGCNADAAPRSRRAGALEEQRSSVHWACFGCRGSAGLLDRLPFTNLSGMCTEPGGQMQQHARTPAYRRAQQHDAAA